MTVDPFISSLRNTLKRYEDQLSMRPESIYYQRMVKSTKDYLHSMIKQRFLRKFGKS